MSGAGTFQKQEVTCHKSPVMKDLIIFEQLNLETDSTTVGQDEGKEMRLKAARSRGAPAFGKKCVFFF